MGVVVIKTNADYKDQFEIKLIEYLQSEEGTEYLKNLVKEKLIIPLLLIPGLSFLLRISSDSYAILI